MGLLTTKTWASNGFNGLLDYLGKNFGVDVWAHPETSRGLVATSESTQQSSYSSDNGIDQATDTSTGRAHTQNLERSWWLLDLKAGNSILPTRVGIIGQNHASNQPVAFNFEASNDLANWEVLWESSTAIGQNAWTSIAVSTTRRFRYFRIIGREPLYNSSGTNYLVIGDVEIWGEYWDSDAGAPTPAGEYEITYTGPGTNGVLAWLGYAKDAETNSWTNPDTLGTVAVTQSTDIGPSNTAEKALDRLAGGSTNRAHTQDVAASWWKLDLLSGNTALLEALGIQGAAYAASPNPRNFTIQGSNDDSAWDDLEAVVSDGPTTAGDWFVVDLSAVTTAYRYFRILNTGVDANGTDYLCIGEVEIWGTYNPTPPADLSANPWDDVSIVVELETTSIAATGTSAWDVSLWDDGALWSASVKVFEELTADYMSANIRHSARSRSRLAPFQTSILTLRLANSSGDYTPGGANANANLELGREIMITAYLGGDPYPRFRGRIISIDEGDPVGPEAVTTIVAQGAFGQLSRITRIERSSAIGAGELSGARVNRILDDAGWPADRRKVSDGIETLQGTLLGGNPVDELALVALSEGGLLFEDFTGDVVFLDRNDVETAGIVGPSGTPTSTLEVGNTGALPATAIAWAGYQTSRSIDDIVNLAKIGRAGGPVQTRIDGESQAAIGMVVSAVRLDLLNQSNAWPAELAQLLVDTYGPAGERVTSVRLTEGLEDATRAALELAQGGELTITRETPLDSIDQTATVIGLVDDFWPAANMGGDRFDTWKLTIMTDRAASS